MENHCEEENGLQPKKKLMEKELQSFEDVKGIVRGPSTANKKNLAKLEKALYGLFISFWVSGAGWSSPYF